MEENINALDEINKGACMEIDAIKFIEEKVTGDEFKKSLEIQYNKYNDISNRINELYSKYDKEGTSHETNMMTKVITMYGIEMQPTMDHSDSKIAELLLKGTNMGITEGRKILNHKKVDKEVYNIIEEYVTMQEDSIEN